MSGDTADCEAAKMEFTIKELEVTKLNLVKGDVLAIVIKDSDVDIYTLEILQGQLAKAFPNNKAMLFGLSDDSEMRFSVIADPTAETKVASCTTNYCSDCSCGKKEQSQALEQLAVETEKLGLPFK